MSVAADVSRLKLLIRADSRRLLRELFYQLFRNLHRVERRAVGQILKIMDAAKVTTVKSVSVFIKETARRVLKLI
jgi:hypothetical protein